jgi:hypothetical protein
MIQIWTALITILILKVLKTQAKHAWYLFNLVAFIRLNLFVKVDLHKWLDNPFAKEQPPQTNIYKGSFLNNYKISAKTSKMVVFIVS